jgi:hypothetical protein
VCLQLFVTKPVPLTPSGEGRGARGERQGRSKQSDCHARDRQTPVVTGWEGQAAPIMGWSGEARWRPAQQQLCCRLRVKGSDPRGRAAGIDWYGPVGLSEAPTTHCDSSSSCHMLAGWASRPGSAGGKSAATLWCVDRNFAFAGVSAPIILPASRIRGAADVYHGPSGAKPDSKCPLMVHQGAVCRKVGEA